MSQKSKVKVKVRAALDVSGDLEECAGTSSAYRLYTPPGSRQLHCAYRSQLRIDDRTCTGTY